MNYPPNSDKSKSQSAEDKKVERVTSGEAIRRKQSLGKQFSKTFIGGDAKSASQYVIFGVLIPAARDALADGISQGFERLIYGESRSGKRRSPSSGATGYVAYNRMGMNRQSESDSRRSMSRKAQAQHDFDEIVLVNRAEAEEVIDRLYDLLNNFNSATVADLYHLVGFDSNQIDQKWGWVDLRGAGVARVKKGYLLDLPDPEPLD